MAFAVAAGYIDAEKIELAEPIFAELVAQGDRDAEPGLGWCFRERAWSGEETTWNLGLALECFDEDREELAVTLASLGRYSDELAVRATLLSDDPLTWFNWAMARLDARAGEDVEPVLCWCLTVAEEDDEVRQYALSSLDPSYGDL